MIQYLTEVIGLSYPQNKGSIAVLSKLGFKKCGQEKHFGKLLDLFILKL